MSDAHEKAMEAVTALFRGWNEIGSNPDAEHPIIYDTGKTGRYTEQPTVDAVLEAISADGPVIVVDGKVVELTDIDFAFLPDTWTEQVLDAAREVIDE